MAKNAGVRTRPARMTFAVLQTAVACDHRQRAGNRKPRNLLGDCMTYNGAARLPVSGETIRGESLAGRHPLQVFEVDAQRFLPSFVVDCRFDIRLRSRIWIALGCHVEAA